MHGWVRPLPGPARPNVTGHHQRPHWPEEWVAGARGQDGHRRDRQVRAGADLVQVHVVARTLGDLLRSQAGAPGTSLRRSAARADTAFAWGLDLGFHRRLQVRLAAVRPGLASAGI